ncbi:MAG TPA: MarR family transcriptional regulator [Geminicoccaceae bacterium]|nr:MarR family transcriptional regulator [Geminicoccus sp.]HMU51440.1 MarR family transcriptional regulator [Geminicoccaceae bacterium]
MTVAEWVLMRSLHGAEPTPPSVLAARLGMTRGAITKLADRLLAKRLLVRIADPDDGRAQKLALTPAGVSMVPELAALADRNDAEFFDELSAEERELLETILKKLVSRHDLRAIPVD